MISILLEETTWNARLVVTPPAEMVAVARPVLVSTAVIVPPVMEIGDVDPLLIVPLSFTSSVPPVIVAPAASVVNIPIVDIELPPAFGPPTRKM